MNNTEISSSDLQYVDDLLEDPPLNVEEIYLELIPEIVEEETHP